MLREALQMLAAVVASSKAGEELVEGHPARTWGSRSEALSTAKGDNLADLKAMYVHLPD